MIISLIAFNSYAFVFAIFFWIGRFMVNKNRT